MSLTRRRVLFAALTALSTLSPSLRPASAQPAPVAGTTAQGRRFLAGGVDRDESELMKAMTPEFPLTVVLTARDGAYLGDARVRVVDGGGATIVDTHVNAPYLLVDLSPGTYEVEATHAGRTQRRRVQLGPQGREQLIFRWDVPVGEVPAPRPG
jgi:hypothetical protein